MREAKIKGRLYRYDKESGKMVEIKKVVEIPDFPSGELVRLRVEDPSNWNPPVITEENYESSRQILEPRKED